MASGLTSLAPSTNDPPRSRGAVGLPSLNCFTPSDSASAAAGSTPTRSSSWTK